MFVGSVSTIDQLYNGDIDFWSYLDHLCKKLKSISYPKTVLVLMDAFQQSFVDKQNQTSKLLYNKMLDFNCPFELIQNVSVVHDRRFHFKNVLIFIDLTFVFGLREMPFKQFLSSIDQFYRQCFNCSPITAVFNISSSKLYNLSNQVLPNVNKDFRSVLVSTTTNRTKGSVVHIRPIINGCHLYPGVLVPKTQKHFDQLKVSYTSCNLNFSTLNVIINKVNLFF